MSTMTAPGSLETPYARGVRTDCRALAILSGNRTGASIDQQMKNFQQKCEERYRREMEVAMSNLARTKEADREKIAMEEAEKLRGEFVEVMRRAEVQAQQRLAALEQMDSQNQKDLERRAAEWHQEATRQIDETERKQKIRAQQLHAEEQRLERLKSMLTHELDVPGPSSLSITTGSLRSSYSSSQPMASKGRNRQNGPLALEDLNSSGVQWRAKEAANLEAGRETLKNKLKSMEEKYAVSQKAIADAEAEMEVMTKRLASVDQDLEEARRKQEQQYKTISKKEQWENATKAELAKWRLELEVTQRETGRLKVALEDLEISSQRDRTSVAKQLDVLQTEHELALEEIASLRSKNKASASAQRVASKLEAELRNLKAEHEQLQAKLNSAQNRDPVELRVLKVSLNGGAAAQQN